MANLLWGKVFYKDHFAGFLRQEPGQRCSFTYDSRYLTTDLPAIAHTLPLQAEPFFSLHDLHPFFDNLVAEGWLQAAQQRLLGKRNLSRFELLLAFGHDCAGAVSVLDPEPEKLSDKLLDHTDSKALAVMTNRASLSGVQPKLTLVKDNKRLRLAKATEISTHIAKFPSPAHDDLVVLEYLTMLAFEALLPNDCIAELSLGEIEDFAETALIIKRFDRTERGERIHFEEFNQLLNHLSQAKYDGAYKELADFIYQTKTCLAAEVYRLYLRILAGLLVGNTDMHYKNFAMFHTAQGLRLTPSYDQVAAAIYNYKTVALAIGNAANLAISQLKSANIIKLGEEFKLSRSAIHMAFEELDKNLPVALDRLSTAPLGQPKLKNQLINLMEKRWKGTFSSIGRHLSTKR